MMHRAIIASAGVAVAALGTPAHAGIEPPAWDFTVSWGGNTWHAAANADSYTVQRNEDDIIRITGSWTTSDWACEWDLELDPDPFIFNDFSIRNLTGNTQDFTIEVFLGATPVAAPSDISGSISGSIADFTGDGVELRDFNGAALYEALVDGVSARTLYSGAQAFDAGAGLTANIPTASYADEIGPAVIDSIGLRNSFTLSAGDNAQMTSTFLIVPTPGAGALVLMAGLVASRRQRS